MKNQAQWQPTKYIKKNRKLIASRDSNEVLVGSRLIADITADLYGQHLPHHAKGKLLDLGCGKVPLWIAYRDYITDNICVDWGNSLHKNPYLDFEYDLTQPLPFQDNEFDTIILSDVLEHIPQPDKLWQEMARIIAPGGKLLMNTPFFYSLHEQPHDYYRFTEFALRRFVENADLTLVTLEPIGGSPEILADMLAKHFQFMPVVGKGLAMIIQGSVGLLRQTTLGKKLSKRSTVSFPFGYFLIAEKG